MTETALEEYQCEVCYKCQMKFWVPLHLHLTAIQLGPDFQFCCPAGHFQHYTEYPSAGSPEGGEIVQFEVFNGGKSSNSSQLD